MKIAILHPSLAVHGGAENVVVWLAEELASRGHQVAVVTSEYDDQFYGDRTTRPFAVRVVQLGGYELDPVQYLRAAWRLRTELAGFDWVNPHNFPAYIWAALARRLNPRIGPTIWFCEEPMRWFYPEVCNPHVLAVHRRRNPPVPPRPRWRRRAFEIRERARHWRWELSKVLDRWAVPQMDLVLANSEFIAAQVRTVFRIPAQACLLGVPPLRVRNGADPGRTLGQERYILTVSRLHPEKNIETILEALALLSTGDRMRFDRYVVAGDGPQRAYLQRRAAEMSLEGMVEFAGFVSERDLAALYRGAMFVVYLPLDETYGLVIPEAALYDKAVVGPDHGGPSEIIRHGVTGLQVDPTDPQAIARCLADCLRHPNRLRQLAEAAHHYVATELTFSKFVDRFEAHLAAHQSGGRAARGIHRARSRFDRAIGESDHRLVGDRQ